MKIAYLAAANSIHTVRWVNAMAGRGHSVELITISRPSEALTIDPRVKLHFLPIAPPAGYLLNAPRVRRILRSMSPDVINIHYASGYGTLGRLARVRPVVLSVWGSDVTEFPRQSRLRKLVLQANLRFARVVCATSGFLKRETEQLLAGQPPVVVIPFGVDCSVFKPAETKPNTDCFLVGTVKTLEEGYGIDRLLDAFELFQRNLPSESATRLRIVGGGSQREALEERARRLGIDHLTEFLGPVAPTSVPDILADFSVYVALSRIESFGVAILEASACGIPVVVSDSGGLRETVVDGSTGVVVPDGSPAVAADALMRLFKDPHEASSMGIAGRDFVLRNYADEKVIASMEQLYESTKN
jgi:glycosyltransferase involved in cell wall biosynthesis